MNLNILIIINKEKNKMNFNQSKLTKQEWETIEIPLSGDKIKIIQLIVKGFNDVNITYNETNSLLGYLKIAKDDNDEGSMDGKIKTTKMDDYLFKTYFFEDINKLYKKYKYEFLLITKYKTNTTIKIKKADIIRITNNSKNLLSNNSIYEFIIIQFIEKLFENYKINNLKWIYYYYTIYNLSLNNVKEINNEIKRIVNCLLDNFKEKIDLVYLIYNSVEYIEKNNNLIKYSDISLYEHQKKIFTVIKYVNPKLILYIAPTGTGKTLTPLGLSENYKIIYICAARHIGLALAKAAISIQKKVAFAFGCNSSEDIRLHYFSAKEYTLNKKSGGIKKIDNSCGEKVELIICDIHSYLPAMYYMMAHFNKENIISYFDEPTIFLDYENHPLHLTIHKKWKEHLIPNVVLSSATLPKSHEIPDLINDFKERFENSEVYNIVSYDCKKTIPILDSNGFVAMPHYLSEKYDKVKKIGNYCFENLTLMRYLDLNECIHFIKLMNENNYIPDNMKINRNFTGLNEINMFKIKEYYLKILQHIKNEYWINIYETLKINRKKYLKSNDDNDIYKQNNYNKLRKINSVGPGIEITKYENNLLHEGKPIIKFESEQIIKDEKKSEQNNFAIYITTKDAYTLTDGPTLFISNHIEKIADFCIKQSNIPIVLMNEIMEKINFNEEIKNRIIILEKELEDIKEKKIKGDDTTKKTKISLNEEKDVGVNKLNLELQNLYSIIRNISLNETYIPNKIAHLKHWNNFNLMNSFSSDINDETIIKIMSLDVEVNWKILLLLGIGVFAENNSPSYNEIIKELAETQRLYLIIANSDYIYGVNYQFCHAYIAKDMINLTQEKIIQALGRVGRENIQQTYTIRFRNDKHIEMLFDENAYKPEVIIMNILFTKQNICWNNEIKKYENVI
jgi:hypothetical protein